MKAKEQREARDQQLRKEFEEAHSAILKASKQQEKDNLAGNKAVAQRRRNSSSATPTDSRSRALAYSRPTTSGDQGQQREGEKSPIDRTKAAREEMLRRQLLIQIQEEHNAKVLEERRIEAEAARRVRQREEQAKFEHNRENLKRKERADLHRQQLQQLLVEEQEKAAQQREKERLKAERKLQMLKLDLARQREDAQEKIREQEKKAHLNDDENADEENTNNDGSVSPTPNRTTKAKEPPSSTRKANAQNSAILSAVAGGKKSSY